MAWFRRACVATLAGIVMGCAANATCQPIRVRLVRADLVHSVPADALEVVKRAILGSGGQVTFVSSVAEASDLVEFTDYSWALDPKAGVTQTWRLCFRPLDQPEDPPAGRARPANFVVKATGQTLEASMRASEKTLRDRFHELLARFEPVVPR